MSVNQHSKQCLSDSLRFEEKRVKFRPWLQQIVAKLNVNMSDDNVSVQFWYLHSWLKDLTLSQVTSWIVICIKSNQVSNHTIIEELINKLQHVYNNSELRERATCILKALKQKEKSFIRHLTTFKQTLLKAKGLKWDDTVKKTFLSNSLNVMLTWALIATSISVLYDEYIILLQQVSHNLKSIQKTVTQECHTMITIITQQFYIDFMNWESTVHVSVTAAKTEKKHKASDRVSYKTTVHAMWRKWTFC